MLGFLKRNIFNIVCAVVALASIGLGVLGFTSMTNVKEELRDIAVIHSDFVGPAARPLNEEKIEAARQRVETIERHFAALIDRAKQINVYETLEPPEGERFFPEPTSNGRRAFREIYREQFPKLLRQLNAGEPPTEIEVQAAQEAIDEERRLAEGFGGDEGLPDDGRGRPGEETEEQHKSGLITEKEAAQSAAARASISKARQLYCYASLDSFDYETEVDLGLAPRAAAMWRAQVSLWVQQDVVDAIARLNNLTAERLKSEDPDARVWVGVLPVKDLISIMVSDYLPTEPRTGAVPVEGEEPARPPASAEAVFTKNSSTELYDVVQFTLKMVVDSRDIPLIIDEICRDRFHTLLNVQYVYEREALENLAMEGKIYGSEPAVKVVMDFETIFFGDLYSCLMPPVVRSKLGRTCERPEEDQS